MRACSSVRRAAVAAGVRPAPAAPARPPAQPASTAPAAALATHGRSATKPTRPARAAIHTRQHPQARRGILQRGRQAGQQLLEAARRNQPGQRGRQCAPGQHRPAASQSIKLVRAKHRPTATTTSTNSTARSTTPTGRRQTPAHRRATGGAARPAPGRSIKFGNPSSVSGAVPLSDYWRSPQSQANPGCHRTLASHVLTTNSTRNPKRGRPCSPSP
jgi:hypothetical protein